MSPWASGFNPRFRMGSDEVPAYAADRLVRVSIRARAESARCLASRKIELGELDNKDIVAYDATAYDLILRRAKPEVRLPSYVVLGSLFARRSACSAFSCFCLDGTIVRYSPLPIRLVGYDFCSVSKGERRVSGRTKQRECA